MTDTSSNNPRASLDSLWMGIFDERECMGRAIAQSLNGEHWAWNPTNDERKITHTVGQCKVLILCETHEVWVAPANTEGGWTPIVFDHVTTTRIRDLVDKLQCGRALGRIESPPRVVLS